MIFETTFMEAKMYDAFIAGKYEDKKNGGAKKVRYSRVGIAFDAEDGGFDLIIPDQMSVSGKVHVRPRKEREDAPEPGHDFMD